MIKLTAPTFKCIQCNEVWTMYTDKTQSTPWCPFCGYSENERSSHWPEKSVEEEPVLEEDKNTEFLPKKTAQKWSEDRMTEKMCTDGGWWNPITKTCMGSGQGFEPDEK